MRRSLLLIMPILPILLARVAVAEDLAALIQQDVRGSDEARLKVIDRGLAAIPGLLEVIGTETGVPANRAAQSLSWIARSAAQSQDRSQVEWALVNVLMDKRQPPLARQTAARYLWHVASPDGVTALSKFVGDPDVGPDVLWSLQNVRYRKALNALVEAFEAPRGSSRVAVLDSLGRRPDAPVSVLTEGAEDADRGVRIVALQGLGRKADVSVAAFLQGRLGRVEGTEREAALLALVSVGDNLRAAGDTGAARRIYEKAAQADGNVMPAVVRSLEGLAGTGNAETVSVIARFMGWSDPAVQVAAASALARLPGSEATQVLAQELAGASPQKARPILSALADRGDPAAVAAVIPLARLGNVDVRVMALHALGRMGDTKACEVILESCQDPNAADVVRAAAFNAYVAIAAAQAKPEVARGLYESALRMAKTDDEKVAALNGLATVAGPQSLAAIESSLHTKGAVQDAAITAHLAGADALARTGDRDGAIAAYTKLLDIVQTGPRVAEIAFRLGALGSSIDPGSRNGFVTHWWVIGPFPSDKDYGGTDTVYPIEQMLGLDLDQPFGEQKVTWKHQHTLDPEGIMDYVPLFRRHENVLCYAYAEVKLAEDCDARLHLGSDDCLVVWLNGEEAYRFKGPRGLKVGQDTKDVKLRAGVNRILIKVVQGGGDWSSSVQLTDRNDQPLSFEQKTE